MKQKINWVDFHNQVKNKFYLFNKKLWWGDDLDVRFYALHNLLKFKNKKILDIGCNIGVSLGFLDKSNYLFGIDIDKNFIKQAKKSNSDIQFQHCNMNKLPFKNKSFDIIIMMNVIPYYDFNLKIEKKNKFINQVFDEINRVLKKNGYIYLTTPNGNSPYYSKNKIKLKELKNILSKHSYDFKIKGWNNIISKKFSFLQKFFHPKIFYRFDTIWEYFIINMNKKVDTSKYFYVEAKKK